MGRILIIDDSATVVAAVRAALGQDGHQVEYLEVFAGLFSVLSTRPPDLILLDLHMPGISGVKLGGLLRAHTKRAVPVCVYSARPLDEMLAAAREIEAAAVVEKSRPLDDLRCIVAGLLTPRARGSRAAREAG
jgi:DNA-binding response OmpR family regulator